jgi:hypothetical protein
MSSTGFVGNKPKDFSILSLNFKNPGQCGEKGGSRWT